jgi:hypothetical protein
VLFEPGLEMVLLLCLTLLGSTVVAFTPLERARKLEALSVTMVGSCLGLIN